MGNRWNRILLLAILPGILIACPVTTTKPAETKPTTKTTEAKIETLTGLVETGPKGMVITANWTCKCRASYTVIGPEKNSFNKLKGKIVTVSGIITRTSPWSGTIRVTAIKKTSSPNQNNKTK